MKIKGEQYKFSVRRLLTNMVVGIVALMLMWATVSYTDIMMHRSTQEFSSYNLIVMAFKPFM